MMSSCRNSLIRRGAKQIANVIALIYVALTFNVCSAHLTNVAFACSSVPQGVYELIELSEDWRLRLDQIANAGFEVVLNYSVIAPSKSNSSVTKSNLLEYADYAARKRLKIIWSIKDRKWWDGTNLLLQFPILSSELNASDNETFITNVVALLKDSPATWGWYVADDDKNMVPSRIISLANIVRQVDDNRYHKLLTVESSNDWRAGIMQSLEPANDYIGFEHYPIGQFATSAQEYKNTQKRMDEVLGWVKTKNKPLVPVLQAIDVAACYPTSSQWYPYGHWPDASEITGLRDHMLAEACAKNVSIPLILWYSYFDIMRVDPSAWSTLLRGAFAPMRWQ